MPTSDYQAEALRRAFHAASHQAQGAGELLNLLFDELPAAVRAKALAHRDRLTQQAAAAQLAYQNYRPAPASFEAAYAQQQTTTAHLQRVAA